MSIFNITDITTAGAFCNAIRAASESDLRNEQYDEVEPKSQAPIHSYRRGGIVGQLTYALRSTLDFLHLRLIGRNERA